MKSLRNMCCGGNPSTSEDITNVPIWSTDIDKYYSGHFSYALVQPNDEIKDYSQVETTPAFDAVFGGVYDGHGGSEAARFVADNLFTEFIRIIKETGIMSVETLRSAFSKIENDFLEEVHKSFESRPAIAHAGTCCLVGIIWKGTLFIASLGDSRAVLGSSNGSRAIVATQLTEKQNVNCDQVRHELRSLHLDDQTIVVKKEGVWRVKGMIEVTRAIGDAYLKKPEYRFDASFPRYHLPEPILRPVISAVPSILTWSLTTNDRFLILASDSLWDHITNQEAVNIVHRNPREGIARILVERALKKRWLPRRGDLDDMTVIVIYTENQPQENVPEKSIKGFFEGIYDHATSLFYFLRNRSPFF